MLSKVKRRKYLLPKKHDFTKKGWETVISRFTEIYQDCFGPIVNANFEGGIFPFSIFFSFFGLANILKSAKKFCIRMKNTVSYYICVRFVVHFLLNYQKRNFEVITFSSRLLGSTLFEAWGEIECCWWKKKLN